MRPLIIFGLVWVTISFLWPALRLSACTVFYLKYGGFEILGKNLDWDHEEGLIYVNKQQSTKDALMIDPSQHGQPARWTSRYGSITFNQHGREMPMGGMNEQGLVVEALLLGKTRYPGRDRRPTVRGLQWVQYQLDMHRTVEEVIASDAQIRIRPTKFPGHHYLVADRSGDCATIEFINGEMVYHRGDRLPVRALTNTTYAKSLHYWHKGRPPLFDTFNSVWRFLRVARKLQDYDPARPAVDYAFEILDAAGQAEFTRWSIVYDIQNQCIHFLTRGHKPIRHFDLTTFNFSCATPVRQLDIQARLAGDVSRRFSDYDYLANRDLITKIYRNNPYMSDFPAEVLEVMARPPVDLPCSQDVADALPHNDLGSGQAK